MYKDDHTKIILGHVCERKRAADTWVLGKVKEDIARLGYQDVILKVDGEQALVQVLDNVTLAREAPSIIQHSPAYDPTGERRGRKSSSGLFGISKGHEDCAGSAVEVQGGVRLEDHGMDHGTRR